MIATKTIAPEILTILASCAVEGVGIKITSGQLDRKTYDKVNDVLTLMGGKWNRAKRMHMFLESPADLLETVCTTGEITDTKKEFQFFETPTKLAKRMIELAELKGDDVLEPSAGRGAIVNQLDGQDFGRVFLCELDPQKFSWLRKTFTSATIFAGDFLKVETKPVRQNHSISGFGVILMNPPFSGKRDIQHIRHAITLLAPGGRLVAICANGPGREDALRFYNPLGLTKLTTDHWEELPAGTFKESGTNVRTILMRIRRSN